jgi:phosphoinositide-3-kinase regulatory subunit 4
MVSAFDSQNAEATESSLLVVTSKGVIAVLDLRTMVLKQRLQHPLELGPITAVCPTTHWIMVGTMTGALSLWDLRFGLLVKSWSSRGGITSLGLHPARGRGRWVIASIRRNHEDPAGADTPLVETYDIETGKLVEEYETRTSRPQAGTRAPALGRDVLQTKSELIAELAGGRGGVPSTSSDDLAYVEALLVGETFSSLSPVLRDKDDPTTQDKTRPGWMVTAGTDRVIRYWDVSRPSEGFVVCGSQREKDVSFRIASGTPQLFYTLPVARPLASAASAGASAADRAQQATNTQRQPLRPHYDSICSLGLVETPYSSCIISADRSGVIKVWRMEAAPSRRE